jgi:hypothetical protein
MQDCCCKLLAVPSTWRRGIANFRIEARDSVCRGSETVSHPAPRKQSSRAAEPQKRGEEEVAWPCFREIRTLHSLGFTQLEKATG